MPEAYVHRIGRTARAGAAGIAISLCADDERGLLRDIQKLTRQTIPAFDRRNDRRLGAITAAMGAAAPTVAAPRPDTPHHRLRPSRTTIARTATSPRAFPATAAVAAAVEGRQP